MNWKAGTRTFWTSVALGLASAGSPALALDFVYQGPPLETPDSTYGELVQCLTQKGAFKTAPVAKAIEDCMTKARGLTVPEYQAMSSSCLMTTTTETHETCKAGLKKLGLSFVRGGPPVSPRELTAAELVAIETGCPSVADAKERDWCFSAIKKLKSLLLDISDPPSGFQNFSAAPTAAEYIAWIKAMPRWINAPNGNAIWLMDPLGQLFRDKAGKPIDVPLDDKPAASR
jgi:hypothetical protein